MSSMHCVRPASSATNGFSWCVAPTIERKGKINRWAAKHTNEQMNKWLRDERKE